MLSVAQFLCYPVIRLNGIILSVAVVMLNVAVFIVTLSVEVPNIRLIMENGHVITSCLMEEPLWFKAGPFC
jgi:hypothetical protein